MRAVVVNETGGPEVLAIREVEPPRPAPGELLVEAGAIGVNFIEIYQRSGVYKLHLPFTPGAEASGTVLEIGEGATGFAPGDRVATAGATGGTYAEQFVVPAAQAAHVPDGVDLETAAALPLQGCTAHYLATSAAHP